MDTASARNYESFEEEDEVPAAILPHSQVAVLERIFHTLFLKACGVVLLIGRQHAPIILELALHSVLTHFIRI